MKQLSERTKQLMTYAAGYIALLPNGIMWYWGNVSIYVYSYFHQKNQSSESAHHQDMKAPWLLSMYVISMSAAVMASGYVNNKIGRRPTLLLGIALFDGGLVASYFVFGLSMTMLDVTMGILCGVGNGLLHSMILQTVVEWTTKHLGLITAFLLTSYAIGSVVINQLITHYLNPENKKVDIVIGKTHFFSQTDILEKVPSMFLALSTTCVIFHVVAFLLLRVKRVDRPSKSKGTGSSWKEKRGNSWKVKKKNSFVGRKESIRLPKPNIIISRSDSNLDKLCDAQTSPGSDSNSSRSFLYRAMDDPSEWSGSHLGDSPRIHNDRPRSVSFSDNHMPPIVFRGDNTSNGINRYNKTDDDDDDYNNNNTKEKSPCQVLRSRFFYVLWFIVFGTDGAFMTLCNYYKVFGQVSIKDDHFLTNLATTFAVFTVIMRLVWGLLTDFMGLKPALVTFTSGLALVSAGYYFTASLNKWLFFVATVLFGCLNCGVYVNFIVAMHALYGTVNFTKNYGLLASATIILNLVFPPLTKLLLSHFGWFGLFFFVSSLNFCSLLLVVCTLSD